MFAWFKHNRLTLLALLLLGVTPLFFWGGPDSFSWPVFSEFWNLGHFGAFALVGLAWQWWRGPVSRALAIKLSIAVLLLGVAIELVQSQVGRDASALDVWHDLVGFWLGLAWALAGRWWLKASLLVLALPAVMRLLLVLCAQVHQASQFPLLNGFESPWDKYFIRGQVARDCTLATQGQCSLRVELPQSIYPGARLETYGGDWSRYTQLAMDFYNPRPNLQTISFRINDLEHERGAHANRMNDRFNRRFELQSGWNHLVIPLAELKAAPAGREMDLAHIYALEFFVYRPPQPLVIYWDNLHLE